MAKTLLSSAVFDADVLSRELDILNKAIPPDAKIIPFDGPRPAGAIVFTDSAQVRLVLQYQIKTDTHVARFRGADRDAMNSEHATCPRCGHPIYHDSEGEYCPHCGPVLKA